MIRHKEGDSMIPHIEKITGELYALWDIHNREMSGEERAQIRAINVLWRAFSDSVKKVEV
jgi:hypothetical protein|tara:strand:- start:477 stop:656 length:180 start_codon:yes stop_codon:yes gene_type:complete